MHYDLLRYTVVFLFATTEVSCGGDASVNDKDQAWEKIGQGQLRDDGMFIEQDGRFMVAFPGAPVHSTESVETEAGKIRMDLYVYDESATLAYMVAFSDYPSGHVEKVGPANIIQNAMEGSLKPLEIQYIDQNDDIVLNDSPGKIIMGRSPRWHIVSQLVMMENRLYQCTILRDGSYPSDAMREAFIGSFHLLDKDPRFQ